MRKILLSILMALAYLASFSQCEEDRFTELIFPSASVESDIMYGSNIDFEGNDMDLFLDVYTPDEDTETSRPLVIFAHGGSFISGSKEGDDVVPLCNDFARMGYVTASIQYRLGITPSFFIEQPATHAVIRGFHDMKAAIRFFRKTVEEDGNPYGINTDQIYLAGVSAGGFITLHNAYLDQDSEIPVIVNQTEPGLEGGVEGNSGNEAYSSEIHGIVNICGAIADTAMIDMDDTTPVVSFHAPDDDVVPFGSTWQTLAGFPVVEVDGSESIHIKADEAGLTNCFEIYEGQGHVPHVSSVAYYDTTRAIMSNFLAHLVCPDFELDCEYRELNIVSVTEQPKNESFMVYPNPAADEVFMILPQSSTHAEIKILDNLGRIVLSTSVEPMHDRIELNTELLENGNYVILWSDEVFKRTEQLIIAR